MNDPTVQELIDSSADLAEAAETLLDTPIVPGSPLTRKAFAALRTSAAAMRRVLGKLPEGGS